MKEIKVLCGIIEKDGLVLITQRVPLCRSRFYGNSRGGKLEPGETEQQCLAREIREELSITVTPVQRLEPAHYTYPDKSVELIPYTCSYVSGDILLLEHVTYKWVKPEEMPKYNWCPADIPIVEAFLKHVPR